MAGEFTKDTKIRASVNGTIANADENNRNIAGLSKDSILGIDVDGEFADVHMGDETIGTDGALIKDIKVRETNQLEIYDSLGGLVGNVAWEDLLNLQSATTLTQEGTSFLPKQILMSNGTDLDHDIDFTTGNFVFDDGSGQAVASALTKRLDAEWAEGSNVGGLDTGTISNNATYHCFAIFNPTSNTSDFLFSTSFSSPTFPSGYTLKKWVGAVITNGSANIIRFLQNDLGDGSLEFIWDTPQLDFSNTSRPITSTVATLTIPNGIDVMANIAVSQKAGNTPGDVFLLIRSPNQTDMTPSTDLHNMCITDTLNEPACNTIHTSTKSNTVRTIRIRFSSSNNAGLFKIFTRGWIFKA